MGTILTLEATQLIFDLKHKCTAQAICSTDTNFLFVGLYFGAMSNLS